MTRPRPIDDRLLEDYHDGILNQEEAARVAEVLRRDPRLRTRLDAIERTDRLIAAALSEAAPEPRLAKERRTPIPVPALVLGMAAGAAGAIVLGVILLRNGLPPAEEPLPARALRADAEHEAESEPYRAIRVVLDLGPVRPVRKIAHEESVPETEPEPGPPSTTSPPLPRDISAAALLRELRSLPLEAQLDRCRTWTDDPRLRPVVFRRLRELAREEGAAGRVAALAAELRERPELRPWVRSYHLPSDHTRAGPPRSDAPTRATPLT